MASTTTPGEHPRPATAQAALRQARLVIGALVVGPILFWAVTWFLNHGVERGPRPSNLSPSTALLIWTVLAVGTFAGALVFRGRALEIVEAARRSGNREAVFARSPEVQTFLVIAMALIEGQALFAGVMYFLLGEPEFVLYSAPLLLVGTALIFPRAEWFGADGR